MPAALLLWLVVFSFSLKSYLLHCVLNHWWPHAAASHLRVISGADGVSIGTQNVSFGMPVAPTLAPWGTIERSRGLLEHKNGDVGMQAWISVDCGRI